MNEFEELLSQASIKNGGDINSIVGKYLLDAHKAAIAQAVKEERGRLYEAFTNLPTFSKKPLLVRLASVLTILEADN